MKKLALLFAVLDLMIVVGCYESGTKRVGASPASAEAVSVPAAQGPGTETNAQQSTRLDPAASGGSNLPASTPYIQASAPVASQNLNPAPFLTTAESAAARVPAPTWSPALTSRADGTMYGPGDRPAAGIGQGIMAADPQSANRPSKKKAAPPK